MAISWKFDEKDTKDYEFEDIPDGKYRVRIEEVIEQTSGNAYPQVKVILAVNGFKAKLHYMITFNPQYKQMVNQQLKDIAVAFGMNPGTIPNRAWVGLTGGAKVNHREYNGNSYAQVHYFIKPDGLPEWEKAGDTVEITPDDLPF